jgi:hypothetical protein
MKPVVYLKSTQCPYSSLMIILLVTLLSLLFACTDEYVLQAHLTEVNDKKETRTDEMDKEYFIRSIYIHYRAINKSNDSIFIPMGYPYDSPVTVSIKSKDSLKISRFYDDCSRFNGYCGNCRHNYFAPGDSISIELWFHIFPQDSTGSEWLQKVSTKELMSKLEFKMVKPTNVKDADMIPNIVFHNDTDDICINPIIRPKKQIVTETDSDDRGTGE